MKIEFYFECRGQAAIEGKTVDDCLRQFHAKTTALGANVLLTKLHTIDGVCVDGSKDIGSALLKAASVNAAKKREVQNG